VECSAKYVQYIKGDGGHGAASIGDEQKPLFDTHHHFEYLSGALNKKKKQKKTTTTTNILPQSEVAILTVR
jgi:hypothetical protein